MPSDIEQSVAHRVARARLYAADIGDGRNVIVIEAVAEPEHRCPEQHQSHVRGGYHWISDQMPALRSEKHEPFNSASREAFSRSDRTCRLAHPAAGVLCAYSVRSFAGDGRSINSRKRRERIDASDR